MLVPEMNTPEWRMTTGEMSEEEATLQFTIRTFILHVQRRVLGAVGGGQPCSADAEIDGSIPSLIICGSISERGFPGLYPHSPDRDGLGYPRSTLHWGKGLWCGDGVVDRLIGNNPCRIGFAISIPSILSIPSISSISSISSDPDPDFDFDFGFGFDFDFGFDFGYSHLRPFGDPNRSICGLMQAGIGG